MVPTVAEQKAHVAKLSETRVKLQKKVLELNTKRDEFLKNKQKELAKNKDTLGSQVEETLMEQIEKKGFNVKK